MSQLNRASLRQISNIRIKDALILIKGHRYCGAYYLTGYAVECALKARIAQNTKKFDFPDKQVVSDSYTHILSDLFRIAELQQKFEEDIKHNLILKSYWLVVKDWSVISRYNQNKQRKDAEDLFTAVTDSLNGILQWIEKN